MDIKNIEKRSRENWINRYKLEDDYELNYNTPIQFEKEIRDFLSVKSNNIILDIGCGIGRASVILSSLCNLLISFDISYAAVKRKAITFPTSLNFVGDMENISLNDQSVDAVFCWRVLHNLTERQRTKAIKSIFRILKPGGSAIFALAALTEENIKKYTTEGYKLHYERNTYVVNKKEYLRLKHFYRENDIKEEFSPFFNLEIIDRVIEFPGWKEIYNEENYYWIAFLSKR